MAIRTSESPAPARFRRRLAALALLGLSAGLWLFAGPASPAHAAWTPVASLPGLGGGRIWHVIFSDADPTFAAAATDNGVYVSADAGLTWTATPLKKVRVWTVGFDIRTPRTLYAGLQGAGIRVSNDLGKTWTDASQGLSNRNVRCFGFSLGGIAAGTDDGVALSVDGVTWHDGGLGGHSVSALTVAANSPAPVLIAGVDSGDTTNGFLFRSTGAGGQWVALTNGLGQNAVVSSLAAGPLSQAVSPPARPVIVTTSKTFRTGDATIVQPTWTPSVVPDGVFLTTTTFSPLDPNLVYGGADAGGSSGGALLRSTDGGQTFTPADQGLPASSGPGQPVRKEVASIAVARTTPPTLLAAINPFDGNALIYRNIDTAAPTPPALVTEPGGVATIPPSAAAPRTASATPVPLTTASPPPSNGFLGRLAGGALHFPAPLVFEVLFVGLLVFLFLRWRRRYYVEGPP